MSLGLHVLYKELWRQRVGTVKWLAGHGSKIDNEVWASEKFWHVNAYRGY